MSRIWVFHVIAQVVWFVGASEPQGRNCSDSPVRVGKFLKWGISKKCPKKPRRLTPYRLCGDRLWARRIGQIWWCRVRNGSFSPKRSPCHPEGWRQPTGCPHRAVIPSRRCVWFANTNNGHRALGSASNNTGRRGLFGVCLIPVFRVLHDATTARAGIDARGGEEMVFGISHVIARRPHGHWACWDGSVA